MSPDSTSGPAVPRSEIDWRIARLRESLHQSPVTASLAIQRVEVLYFAGTPQDGIVWIPREGEPVFLVRRDLERARRESPLPRVVPFARPKDIPALLAEQGLRIDGPVGTSLDVLPVKLHQSLSRALGVPLEDVSAEARGVRIVKSPWEQARVREAGALADALFTTMKDRLRPGMRETDVAAEVDGFLLRSSSVPYYRTRTFNLEFPTLCAIAGESGDWRGAGDSPNSAGRGLDPAFGQGPSTRKIERGEPILIDVGTSRGGYYADTTRIFHFGELPERFVAAHRLCEEILSRAIEEIEGGRSLEDVYASALGRAQAAGLAAEFMGGSRFLGHGVGLEIDEWPVVSDGFDEPLPEGAVLSLEPKVAQRGGIVGAETTFILEGGRMRPVSTVSTALSRLDR